jgi:hypothetical protein
VKVGDLHRTSRSCTEALGLALLEDRGLAQEPANRRWGARLDSILDPDGRRVSIYSADRPTM